MNALDIPLADIAQIAAVDLEHLRAAGDFDRDPLPGGPLRLHLAQCFPNARIRVFQRVFSPRLHIQGQHDVKQCPEMQRRILKTQPDTGAQRIRDEDA